MSTRARNLSRPPLREVLFFVSLVLADAHLAAGDAEQARAVVLGALSDGDQIRSARCVSYLREFRKHLPVSAVGAIAEFRELASGSRLRRIASCPGRPKT